MNWGKKRHGCQVNEREEKLLSKVPNTHTNKGILLKNHTRRKKRKEERKRRKIRRKKDDGRREREIMDEKKRVNRTEHEK